MSSDLFSTDIEAGRRRRVERFAELAKTFLSSLFMGLRTARIHSSSNRAFDNAVRTLYDATQALYAATGGFRIVFVGDTTILNDERLRIDSSTFAITRTLRSTLESKEMGGIGLSEPPTFESCRAMIEMMSREGGPDPAELARAALLPIPPQAFADTTRSNFQVDPRERAVRVYAKLLIALRHNFERFNSIPGAEDPRKVRLVRLIQDLVEVTSMVPATSLLLANHRAADWPTERHGANTCVLAVSLGLALGLDRGLLMDLGVAAALHHLGLSDPHGASPGRLDDEAIHRGVSRLLSDAGVSPATLRRATAIACHRRPVAVTAAEATPPLSARIIGLCATYDQLCSGFGLSRPIEGKAVEVLAVLHRDPRGRFDPDLVDLLINVLRVFPVGVEVVLQSGGRGIVSSHGGSRRWDRPVVAQVEPTSTHVDLMLREGERFRDGIVGTIRFLGAPPLVRTSETSRMAGRGAEPVTTDLDQLERPQGLSQMPKGAEELVRDFLSDDD